MAELFAPMPESLRPFNPKMSHLLLNEREMPPESLKDDSIAAQLVRLEQAQSEQELNAAIGAVLELLPDAADPRQAALLAAFSLFYASTVAARFGARVPQSFDLRKERPMLAETVDRWREEAIAKGLAQGRAQGRAEGEARGIAKGLREAARRMLAAGGIAPEAVARMLGLDEGEVRALAAAQ